MVFSKALNPQMTVLAVEGSYASVLGGAPAAAVVFSRDVDARTAKDPRVTALEEQLAAASGADAASLATELAELRRDVRSEKLGEVATEFDRVHNIHRAVEVGSVDEVIAAPAAAAQDHHGAGEGAGLGLTWPTLSRRRSRPPVAATVGRKLRHRVVVSVIRSSSAAIASLAAGPGLAGQLIPRCAE